MGATFAILGSVPERLRFAPTFVAQIAASFAGTLAPASIGGLALNARYLQKSGIDPAVAVPAVGLNAIAGVAMHIVLLTLFLVWAGTSAFGAIHLPDPEVLLYGAAAVVALGAIAFAIPAIRHALRDRLVPILARSISGLFAVVRRPMNILLLLGGSVVVTSGYLVAMYFAVQAFGGDLSFAQVGAIYLTGSAIASAAPTPGGIGALEAAVIAGLVAAGMPNDIAVPSVFLFRLGTFWLPILPGWGAFTLDAEGRLLVARRRPAQTLRRPCWSPRRRICATTRIWITDVTMMPKKPITCSAVAKSSSLLRRARRRRAARPRRSCRATRSPRTTIRSTHSSTTSRSAPANRSTRMREPPPPQLGRDRLEVRRQGAQRRQRPHALPSPAAAGACPTVWSASSGRSAVASCAMLNDGSMVRSVPSSVSSARDSTVIAPGTSSPWRCMTSSIRLIACGSKLPAPRPSLSTRPMSASSARLSPPSSPPARWLVARGEHDGVVELEADRHLLHRLEHHRAEPARPHRSRGTTAVPRGRRRCSPGADRRGTGRRAAPGRGTTAAADWRGPWPRRARPRSRRGRRR